jgi:hypothetical protein
MFLLDSLGPGGIIPDVWGEKLFLKLCQLFFLAVYLKDAPSGQVYVPSSPGVSASIQLTYVNSSGGNFLTII